MGLRTRAATRHCARHGGYREETKKMKNNVRSLIVVAAGLLHALASHAGEWNATDYDLYPGDFNADGRTDILYVAKSANKGSGVALSDGSQPIAGHQVWHATGFGIPWHSNVYLPVIGDFNWDGRSDVFMHRQTPGDHYLLLASENGTFAGISQTIANNSAGYVWSGDQHRVIAVRAVNPNDYEHYSGHRLFLQSTSRGGSNGIVSTSPQGLIGSALGSPWTDGYQGFQWNLRQAIVHSGDFNEDGHGDLLIQAKPDIALIDYDIPIPVPTYRPQSFGIVYSPIGSGPVQMWNRVTGGVDWSAAQSNVVIGDFDGNGRDDIIVQPKRSGVAAYVIAANESTGQVNVASPAAITFGSAGSAVADAYRMTVGNFSGGFAGSGLYLQSTSSGTADLIVPVVSLNGGAMGTSIHNPQYQSSPTPGTGVGSIPGSFSVDPSGAATYRIPIEVPPGIAGVKPDLALSYSSRSGNGLVGVGWTVTGMSAITRCPTNHEVDGMTDGVDLDSWEAYCLDGARLKAISGAEGGVGAEYRTELESFQKVASSGGVNDDPGSWTVRDKAGLIRYYGTTSDSRIELQGKSQAHVWAVKRIEDRFNNFIEYSYSENTSTSSFEPIAVRWGNGSGGSANVVGKVVFEYGTRADPTRGYLAGSVIGSDKFLRLVDVFSRPSATSSASDATTRVRTYYLNYEKSPTSGLTHMKELVLCDGAGGAARRCLASTKFRWQHGTSGLTAEMPTGVSGTTPNLRPVDLNADGRTDYLWTYGGSGASDYWAYKKSSLTAVATNSGISTRGSPWNAILIDYNNDGYTDILQSNGGTYEWIAGTSTGLGSTYPFTNIPAEAHTHAGLLTGVGDFNGDGASDLAYAQPVVTGSSLKIHFNQASGFTAQQATNTATIALGGIALNDPGLDPFFMTREGVAQGLYVINFDGDGRDDVLVRVGTNCVQYGPGTQRRQCSGQRYNVYSYSSETHALTLVWSHVVDASNPEWQWPKLLDANGDGLTDILYATSGGWVLRVGTGSAVQGLKVDWSASNYTGNVWLSSWSEGIESHNPTQIQIPLNADRLRYAQTMDYDRDGRMDLLFGAPNGSGFDYWTVLRNTGAGFAVSAHNTALRAYSPQNTMVVDDRGDGIQDLVLRSGFFADHNYYIAYGRGPTAGVVDRITDGLGAVTQVQYAPLTEQDTSGVNVLYDGATQFNAANGSTAAVSFPYVNVLAPIVVVSQIAQDNGLGQPGDSVSSVQTAYKYAGLKAHRQGRGLLGFSRVIAKNVNTTIVTVNEYAQQWPYTGMVTKSEQRYPDTTVTQNTQVNMRLGYGAECETSYNCGSVRVTLPIPVVVAGPPITSTVNILSNLSWSLGGRWFPYTLTSTETVYPLQGSTVGSGTLKRTVTEYLGSGGNGASNRYDDYGNPYYIRVTVDDGEGGDGHVTTTSNTYTNDATNWCLGRLTDTVVTHSKSLGLSGNTGAQTITRHSTFTYNAAPRCTLDRETIEPGTALEQWTDHNYDGYGNKISSTVGGANVAPEQRRTTSADYAFTQGQFAHSVYNALGQSETNTWDPRFGVKATVTGPNGLTSTVTVDSFGRTTSETPIAGLGVYTNTTLYWCAQIGCADARSTTVVHGTNSDGSQVRSEFDRLGRETVTSKLVLDGRWLTTEKRYDPLGREYLASQPYFDSNKKCWTFRRFDLLGRVVMQRDPYKTGTNGDGECVSSIPAHTASDGELPGGSSGGRLTHMEYDIVDGSLIGTRTNAHSNDATARRTGVKWVNVFGRTRVVQDELASGACSASSTSSATCYATAYDHDAQGNLTLVRRSGQISAGATPTAVTIDTHASFNVRGFKTGMTDPDMGTWFYGYNSFGELTSQTDAKNQVTTIDYDKLGRMMWRTEGSEGTTNWYYDEVSVGGSKSIGKATRVVGPGGTYEERYVYDDLGRLSSTKRKIDGNWHRIDQTYDAQSRLDLLKYPTWNSVSSPDTVPADSERVVIRHTYNSYGFLTATRNEASGTTYWQVNTIDQYGVTRETLGNGVVTNRTFEATTGYLRSITAGIGSSTSVENMSFTLDRNGNLLGRADANLNRSEDFTYDAVDRLTQTRLFNNAAWTGGAASTETMYYDAFGNIRSKGTAYSNYNYTVDTSGVSLCNAPANPTAQPHAVRQVTVGAAVRTQCYDRNGNIVKQVNGQYDTATWWVSNLARRISKGSEYAEFTYGPDRARYKQTSVRSGVSETTTYVGGVYERFVRSGVTEHTFYINGGGGAVAIYKRADNGGSTTVATKYLHRDHLGSVVALSDEAGNVAAADRMSFDAWGKRRANTWVNAAAGTQISPTTYTSFTRRGFTGHEQLDFLGVVHMNGRVYDSEIGRFLSADPFVQFPESTQGLNRYAYVGNNPLSRADPSGFFVDGFSFAAFMQALFQIVAQYYALLKIAFGAPGAGAQANPLEHKISVGFGTGESGRWGQRIADIRTGVKRAGDLPADILLPTSVRMRRDILQATVAGTGAKHDSGLVNGAASNAMNDALKADRAVNSAKERLRLNDQIHDDAVRYRKLLASLESDEDFVRHFAIPGSADYRYLLSDSWRLWAIREALDASLAEIIFKSGNGVLAAGTEVIQDKLVESTLKRGLGAGAKMISEQMDEAWRKVKSTYGNSKKVKSMIDRKAGESTYGEISCDVYVSQSCTVTLHERTR